MVQFGKTQTTTNSAVTNYDLGDRRTINSTHNKDDSTTQISVIEDKTHKEYFNSKDIIHTVNNYQNVNMSLLLATMALSVVAPIINGLINKAINKWNEDVPENMQEMANKEFDLIHGKCKRLMIVQGIPERPQQRISDKVTSEDFLSLQDQVNSYLKRLLRSASDNVIEGIIKKDRDQISDGERLLLSVKSPFKTSFESHIRYTSSPEQIGIFQYDQAIAALNRILPSAMLGDSTTMLVRTMVPIHYVHMKTDDLIRFQEIYRDVYHCSVTDDGNGGKNMDAVPIHGFADLETVSGIYGVDLTQICNAHFFSSCQNGDQLVTRDSNFSGKAILETKLGHSMAVLGETVNEVADVMLDVLRRKNPNEDIQHSYRRVEKEPWHSGRSTRQFTNLMSVFSMKDETDIITADRDFRTLSSLIQVIGTMKKLYPELLPRSDPQMKAFIRQCRFETGKINQLTLSPSAPESSIRSERTGSYHLYPPIKDVAMGLIQINEKSQSESIPISELNTTTSLDTILMESTIASKVVKRLHLVSDIKAPLLKQLKSEFEQAIYMIVRQSGNGEAARFKVILSKLEELKSEMGSKKVMDSDRYKGIIWYAKGSYFFDKDSMFYDVMFE